MIYRTEVFTKYGAMHRARVWCGPELVFTTIGTSEDEALSRADDLAAACERADAGPAAAMTEALRFLDGGADSDHAAVILRRGLAAVSSATPHEQTH